MKTAKRAGFTLIELMVAMILTVIVGWVAFDFMSDEHGNYTVTREKIRLQSDARDAVRLMEDEIKNIGYATSTTLSGTALTITTCTDIAFATTSATFDTPAAGRLKFHMYSPFVSFSCGADRWTIAYRLNNRTLERAAWQGADKTDANATWVPFMQNVDSFRIGYGIVNPKTELITVADLTSANAPSLFTLTGGVGIEVDQSSATDRPWRVKSWSTTAGRALLNKDLALVAGATYRIAFQAQATASFLSNAVDTKGRFVLTQSGVEKVSITFEPGKEGAPRQIQYDFTVPSTGTYKLGLASVLTSNVAAPADCWVQASSLRLLKLSNGDYPTTWNDESSPAADWGTIGAVRIQLQVADRNDGKLNFDRIIPVVNNAYND